MNYIGIDLGTTFSAVAYLDELGVPRIIKDENGDSITPSCIAMIAGNLEVGARARRHWGNAPDEAAARFKRDMGTSVKHTIDGKEFDPTELSTIILKRMRQIAKSSIGSIGKAVVTIPANFAHEAREATMIAAREAGLDVEFIVNEPTAAALYYAYAEQEELFGKYAVYDLGGGTFDVSIIEVNGSSVDVIASNGVSKLGGDDFDKKLWELVAEKYLEETGKKIDPEDFTINDAEELKITLSKRKRVTAQIGRTLIDIRRDDFEEDISALVAQTEMLCEATLDEADIDPQDVKAVFLAGGSTRIPVIQSSIEKIFLQEPISTANVDEVVSLGAALYAAFKSDKSDLTEVQQRSLGKIQVTESTAMCFGTIVLSFNENRDDYELSNSVLIKKGEKIPTSVTETYYTSHDGQTSINCRITESRTAETNPKFVKEIWSGDLELPPNRPEGQEIEVNFAFNDNQIMTASFTDVRTSKSQTISLSMSSKSNVSSEADKFTI